MVQTRHSTEASGTSPPTLLSFERRSIRKPQRLIAADDENSDDSGVVHITKREIAHYQEQKSSSGRPRGRPPRRLVISSADDDSEDDEVSTKRRQTKIGKRHSSIDGDIDGGDAAVRRSSRQKKLVYGTFDQKMLDKVLYLDGVPVFADEDRPRKRKTMEVQPVADEKGEDMYSRVKRVRRSIKRDMYGIPIPESESENSDDSDDENNEEEEEENREEKESGDDEEEDNEEEEEEEEDDAPPRRSYNLREYKPRTQLFEVPIEKRKTRVSIFRDASPPSPIEKRRKNEVYRSPAHRTKPVGRRKAAYHGNSSTSSSSSSSSDDSSDEERFKRRKAKSMAKARNQCLPMNMSSEEVNMSGVLRDRAKIGSSLADVDPMSVDRSTTFESVGGLGKHVRALKEMVVFPLLYPEVFERFKISPPRGCLFYGPPGTGKTLVARALANECSSGEKRVAFFMRKGADCLSKWVGESERQLRLLFDQAYQMRPSIIFFDEIDGLAPVRSSRQDQIHSSIVSTLLALMDGLDSRGEIVVIGATNRIDSIDPALRRPGRFDREFLFPLPSQEARRQILHIQTKAWNPKLLDIFVKEVAERTVGYCGADLKALCTESALIALRRRYPQIYTTSEKLQLDVSSISVGAKDFFYAMKTIVPASQRSVSSPARSLANYLRPLLKKYFEEILQVLQNVFPIVLAQLASLDAPATSSQGDGSTAVGDNDLLSDDEDNLPSIFEHRGPGRRKSHPEGPKQQFINFTSYAYKEPSTHRPRLLLAGTPGQSQSSHLAPALLHHMEQLPVHVVDLPSLFAVSAKTPEESCAQIFREAMRSSPSIVYMPHINHWWSILGDTLRATLQMLIQDLVPTTPILILATSEQPYAELDFQLQLLFSLYAGEVVTMTNPSEAQRRDFFSDLILSQTRQPPSKKTQAATRLLEVLPKAPAPEPRKLTEKELQTLYNQEEATLRELRLFLRDVINKLGRDRKFQIFAKPVDLEDVPDYNEIITEPMDLSTMMSKIDKHNYQTATEFMNDINLICRNALEYNPATNPAGRAIRHRACALKDTSNAILNAELDPEFEKACDEVVASRKRRGVNPSDSAPQFCFTLPKNSQTPTSSSQNTPVAVSNSNHRTSRRARGLGVEASVDQQLLEAQWRIEKRNPSSIKNEKQTPKVLSSKSLSSSKKPIRFVSPSSHKSRPKKKIVWSYTKRRRRKRRFTFENEMNTEGEEEEEEEEEEVDAGDKTDNIHVDVTQELHISPVSPRDMSPRNQTDLSPRRDLSPREQAQMSPVSRRRTNSPRARENDLHKHSPSIPKCSPPVMIDDENSESKMEISHGDEKSSPVFKKRMRKCSEGQDEVEQSDNLQISSPSKECEQESQEKHTTSQDKIYTSASSGEHTTPCKDMLIKDNVLCVNGEVDSGVGSSVDSNGDSLDGVDQAKQLKGKVTTEVTVHREKEDQTKSPKAAEPEDKVPSPGIRMTRSRLQTKEQERALAILEAPSEPVVIDENRLSSLLETLVRITHNLDVEKLEKLYSMLSQCIYHHREEFDKTVLTENLEDCVKRFSHMTSHSTGSV
ncbi:ATPase family AAA domain-containing protein 2B [Mizuhopecten yessoensis]|uniref:ATPase family AAA domain-containing protein 2B n=1 Tax=Mizuhopecten yessoensis TaxID=6573 RepID=A0A210QTE8_MIZYE|nr:ATPase family AAA domain-containing protein 2B [Mizuhopecten yessoensis]